VGWKLVALFYLLWMEMGSPGFDHGHRERTARSGLKPEAGVVRVMTTV